MKDWFRVSAQLKKTWRPETQGPALYMGRRCAVPCHIGLIRYGTAIVSGDGPPCAGGYSSLTSGMQVQSVDELARVLGLLSQIIGRNLRSHMFGSDSLLQVDRQSGRS